MLQLTKAYTTTSGKTFALLDEAQAEEIATLLDIPSTDSGWRELIEEIIKHRDAILNILTTNENSRPKARKANGATRKSRKPQTPAAPVGNENAAPAQ